VAQVLEARTLETGAQRHPRADGPDPSEALLRDASGERRVDVDDIVPGAVIVIRPGEKIPLDGEVLAGRSPVNQASVTGESLPVDKAPATRCSGTINGRGALDVRVTRLRRDTTLARIIHLVERAQAQRAPSQTLVDRFAGIYTPAVILLAVVVAVVPPLAFGLTWHTSVYRALVLLVVLVPVRARHLDTGVDRSRRWPGRRARAVLTKAACISSARAVSDASRSIRPAR